MQIGVVNSGSSLQDERKIVNIALDNKVFMRIERAAGYTPVLRYQYDNHLGSACLELDNTGAIISYEEYHPFGTTSYRSGRSETEVSLKRYKYCGKERDEETGLYYFGARYYAAWLGRFVSCDPLQHEQPNKTPYHYCSNNPVNKVDPTGMSPEDPSQNNEDVFKGFQQDGRGTPENPIDLEPVEIIDKSITPYIFEHEEPTSLFDDLYGRLPKDVQRGITGGWNILSGAAEVVGGLAFAAATSFTGVGAVIGGVVMMHGGYKLITGLQQVFNVMEGGLESKDLEYVTPLGAITENKQIDNVTDLVVGLGTSSRNVPTPIVIINDMSSLISANDIASNVKVLEPTSLDSMKINDKEIKIPIDNVMHRRLQKEVKNHY